MKCSWSYVQYDSKLSQALPPNCTHCSANWLQRWEHSGEQETNHSQLEKGSGSISEIFRTRRHLLKRSLIEDYPLRFMSCVYDSVDDAVHTNNQTEYVERKWYETRGMGEAGVLDAKMWRCAVRQLLNFLCFWIALPLKTGPIGFPETSVNNYQSTPRSIPQEGTSLNL